jgi:hypothetical protein
VRIIRVGGENVEYLPRELAVGGLDVLVARGARHAQRGVVIGRRPDHQAPSTAPPRSPSATPRCSTGEPEDAAPTGGEVGPTTRRRGGGAERRGRIRARERKRGQRKRH